jgi:rRNA-processing protein FCF1
MRGGGVILFAVDGTREDVIFAVLLDFDNHLADVYILFGIDTASELAVFTRHFQPYVTAEVVFELKILAVPLDCSIATERNIADF